MNCKTCKHESRLHYQDSVPDENGIMKTTRCKCGCKAENGRVIILNKEPEEEICMLKITIEDDCIIRKKVEVDYNDMIDQDRLDQLVEIIKHEIVNWRSSE